MKHFYSIPIALLMGAIAPINSMEVTKAALITALITKAPRSVICLKDNNVAVLGKNNLTLYNLSTNKKIIELQSYSDKTVFQYITTDQKKEKLAFYRENFLAVYDLKTKGKMWSRIQELNYWEGAPAFNPKENTLFIGDIISGIDSYDYKEDSSKKYNSPFPRGNKIPYATQLRFHPTQQEMIFLADNRIELPILQFDKDPILKQTISTECGIHGDSIIDAKYSPDGSLIAINNQIRGCSIYDLANKTNSFVNGWEQIAAMIFHPTKTIIATLAQTGDCIKYWNTQTQQLIATTPLSVPYFYNPYPMVPVCEPISFSDYGTKIVIALELKDKCLIIDVPSEVLEQSAWDNK